MQAITAALILRLQWIHGAQRTKFLITREESKWKHPRKHELRMFFETAPFRTGSEMAPGVTELNDCQSVKEKDEKTVGVTAWESSIF